MNKMTKNKGPRFIQYIPSVLDALRDLGASAKPREVYKWIAERQNIPEEEMTERTKNGQIKYENRVGWARFYLAKAGLIDTEKRGVWVLTKEGRDTKLTVEEAYRLFRRIQATFNEDKNNNGNEPTAEAENTVPDEAIYLNEDEIREKLIKHLRNVSDTGFEELCARLLRHIGFENVKVTQRVGDKGIDGIGELMINRFVRSKIVFQCKRYEKTVGSNKIRDFRGALAGRAERGIFLTTGTFTRDAIEEAGRENSLPIELVDIDRLLDLMIEEGLGVKETKALVIDPAFFQPFGTK